MKSFGQTLALLFCCLLLLPLLPLLQNSKPQHATLETVEFTASTPSATDSSTISVPQEITPPTSSQMTVATSSADSLAPEEVVTVFRNATDKQETVPMRDYLIGVVMSEIPISFEVEAIKAQVVVAHSYACYQLQHEDVLTDSPATHQAYRDTAMLQEHFGDSFDAAYQKVAACVDAVYPAILTYQDAPALTAFHAMSAGVTESSANVWGGAFPYLVAVESAGDLLLSDYSQKKAFSQSEVQGLLQQEFPNVVLSADPSEWIVILDRTESNYVHTVQVADQQMTGQEFRSLFSLRSADFDVAYTANVFTFTTRGYGHGVGMSQEGANYYATQGMTYDEILAHYYPGTTLSSVAPTGVSGG